MKAKAEADGSPTDLEAAYCSSQRLKRHNRPARILRQGQALVQAIEALETVGHESEDHVCPKMPVDAVRG